MQMVPHSFPIFQEKRPVFQRHENIELSLYLSTTRSFTLETFNIFEWVQIQIKL